MGTLVDYIVGCLIALMLIAFINRGTEQGSDKRIAPVWAFGSYAAVIFCIYVLVKLVLDYMKVSPNWNKIYNWLSGN